MFGNTGAMTAGFLKHSPALYQAVVVQNFHRQRPSIYMGGGSLPKSKYFVAHISAQTGNLVTVFG